MRLSKYNSTIWLSLTINLCIIINYRVNVFINSQLYVSHHTTAYIKRVIAHPYFHNVSFKECEKLLANMDQGDVIIRPSSKVRQSYSISNYVPQSTLSLIYLMNKWFGKKQGCQTSVKSQKCVKTKLLSVKTLRVCIMVSDNLHCVTHSLIWFLKSIWENYNFEIWVSVTAIFFVWQSLKSCQKLNGQIQKWQSKDIEIEVSWIS